MKKAMFPLLIVLCSCSFQISYESLYRITVSSSTTYRFETTLTDETKQSIQTQASGTYTLCSKTLSVTKQESNSLSDEDFQGKCPVPSNVIKEINVYSVTTSSETSSENLVKTISVNDSEWIYRRLARNMGAYIYEFE